MDLSEKTLNEKVIYEGDYLKFIKAEVELPNGKRTNRDIIKHPGAVAIVAFLDEEHIILIEQFRKPIDKVILEIPAGKLEGNEDMKIAAVRELEEETGYKSEHMEFLGTIAPAPGFCDELLHLFKATGLSKGNTNWDEDEFIKNKVMKPSEVKEKIRKGEIIDAKTICALMYL